MQEWLGISFGKWVDDQNCTISFAQSGSGVPSRVSSVSAQVWLVVQMRSPLSLLLSLIVLSLCSASTVLIVSPVCISDQRFVLPICICICICTQLLTSGGSDLCPQCKWHFLVILPHTNMTWLPNQRLMDILESMQTMKNTHYMPKMQHANQTNFTTFLFQMKCVSALTLNSLWWSTQLSQNIIAHILNLLTMIAFNILIPCWFLTRADQSYSLVLAAQTPLCLVLTELHGSFC